MPRFKSTEEILRIAKNKDQIRNAGIIAHVDHGKTTLTDSLLAASGLLSPGIAGQALALDYLEEEQKRQMTKVAPVYAARLPFPIDDEYAVHTAAFGFNSSG